MARIDRDRVPYLSFSKVSDLDFCEYRYLLTYVKDVRPEVEPAYFRKGHSFHQAVAKYYARVASGKPPDTGAIHRIFDDHHEEADRIHLRNAFELAVKNAHTGWEVLSIEEPFVLEVGDKIPPCVGVIDLVLRRQGTFAVIDHKTGKTFGEPDPFQLALYSEHVRRAYGAKRCLAMFDQYRWVNSLDRIRTPAFERVTVEQADLSWSWASDRLAEAQARISEIEAGDPAGADGPCYMCPLKEVCVQSRSSY